MKKTITVIFALLFVAVSLFAQDRHHDRGKHKEVKKEYRHHYRHDNRRRATVVIETPVPQPPRVVIDVPAPPRPPRPPR